MKLNTSEFSLIAMMYEDLPMWFSYYDFAPNLLEDEYRISSLKFDPGRRFEANARSSSIRQMFVSQQTANKGLGMLRDLSFVDLRKIVLSAETLVGFISTVPKLDHMGT
jgi:hypothetical protein